MQLGTFLVSFLVYVSSAFSPTASTRPLWELPNYALGHDSYRNPYVLSDGAPERDDFLNARFERFEDFRRRSKESTPLLYQIPQSSLNDSLSSALFRLNGDVLPDVSPRDVKTYSRVEKSLKNSPLFRRTYDACLHACPNPDVVEPRVVDLFYYALRELPPHDSFRHFLQRIPDGEGIHLHDLERVYDAETSAAQKRFRETHRSLWRAPVKVQERDAKRVEKLKKLVRAYARETCPAAVDVDEIRFQRPWRWDDAGFYESTFELFDLIATTYGNPRFDRILRDVDALLDAFRDPFDVTGKFGYAPRSARSWHTNVPKGGPGWRVYVVRAKGTSGMNVLFPSSGRIVGLKDSTDEMTLNAFQVKDVHQGPLWHCVWSKDNFRYSLGIKLTEDDFYRLLQRIGYAR